MRVAVVGGGLTGCTVAWSLARDGIESVIFERERVPGGLIRSDQMNGVLYEPHGSHIFHTDDKEVWEIANGIVPFRPYRHRVDIIVEGKRLNWPPLLSDVEKLSDGDRIRRDLLRRRENPTDPEKRAKSANFEEWCLELMGPDLYELFVRPYTEKQWGRPARELSASWAPRRVSVRYDDNPFLFPDAYQGWPSSSHGYADLIDGLIESPLVYVVPEGQIFVGNMVALSKRYEAVVDTCPLDEFAYRSLGDLPWRGILVRSVYVPHVDYAQSAMVVNYPGQEYPFIRVHETKHASGQECEGTVLGFEFTGAPSRYYPIPAPENEDLNRRYKNLVRERIKLPTYFAGRLANYEYLDMDDCMRQALDVSEEVVRNLRTTSVGAGR